jgi:TRAP-type C4-dicarboxylate transport system permease small subunit
MKFIRKIEENFEEWIMVGLLVGIAVVMIIQVFMRYLFKSPIMWAEEACKYMFVWTSFLSLGYCFRRDMLLKVDILYSKISSGIKKVVDFISTILTLVFLGALFIRSLTVVGQIAASGQLSPSLGLPMQYIYAASSVGFFLGLLRYIQFIVRRYILKSIQEKDRLDTTTN